MPRSPRSPRSLLTLLALATAVVVASAGDAVAHQGASEVVQPGPDGVGAVRTTVSTSPRFIRGAVDGTTAFDLRQEHRPTASAAAPAPMATAWVARSATTAPAPKAQTEQKGGGSGSSASAGKLSGRNKVWIPALGIRRSTSFFSCSSKAYPGDRVYRWGCAGRNNIYLFGHAHSVFKPLHDAYVRGRLKKGMKVYYADSKGRVSTYKVIWWRVVAPDKGGFAYASQSRPSMTLQTCVGKRSQYRLVVRLVRV
jgi:hypothetical protein